MNIIHIFINLTIFLNFKYLYVYIMFYYFYSYYLFIFEDHIEIFLILEYKLHKTLLNQLNFNFTFSILHNVN